MTPHDTLKGPKDIKIQAFGNARTEVCKHSVRAVPSLQEGSDGRPRADFDRRRCCKVWDLKQDGRSKMVQGFS